jgi:hypothetical protein
MFNRTNNPNTTYYQNYGGRGIKLEWPTFEEFHKDMFRTYQTHSVKFGERDTTIDRLDNNKNYSKENCRWATRYEQNNNRSFNRKVSYKGEVMNLSQLWAKYKDSNPAIKNLKTFAIRISRGYSISEAIELPTQGKKLRRFKIETIN